MPSNPPPRMNKASVQMELLKKWALNGFSDSSPAFSRCRAFLKNIQTLVLEHSLESRCWRRWRTTSSGWKRTDSPSASGSPACRERQGRPRRFICTSAAPWRLRWPVWQTAEGAFETSSAFAKYCIYVSAKLLNYSSLFLKEDTNRVFNILRDFC